MAMSTFIDRVVIKNYKSIARCDVALGPLALLVGPNGSGKSNFLDALRFTTDGLSGSLDHALRERGGINEVRRRSGGHPTHFGVRLEFQLGGQLGYYAYQIAARPGGAYEVQQEVLDLHEPRRGLNRTYYEIRSGEVVGCSEPTYPPALPDRFYLVNAAGLPAFRAVYDGLSRMGFYNLNPDRIRDLQSPDAGELLARDGSNASSVLAHLERNSPAAKERIEDYLRKVVPGVSGIDTKVVGPKETLEFRQRVPGSEHPWRFLANSMSDGTLRAAGLLLALFQSSNGVRGAAPLIGIEEPEAALHPAAAGVLLDALLDASERLQVVVTSHSPDLLDDERLLAESILAVTAEQGATGIAPVDEKTRGALRDRLYSAGELLRQDQLRPSPEALAGASQSKLFGSQASSR